MSHPHQITIEPCPGRVLVTFGGKTIAESTRAKFLREGPMEPVLYIPREDVVMMAMERTDHETHCPFKGDASHYRLTVGDRTAEDVAWSYEAPKDEVEAIKDHLAFYESKVDTIAVQR